MRAGWLLMVAVLCGISQLCGSTSSWGAEPMRIYVGTYTGDGPDDSRGIYVVDFDAESGKLSNPRLAGETSNPSFLTIDASGKRLYSVAEVRGDEGRHGASLVAWNIEADGTLSEIGKASAGGDIPCFVDLSKNGRLAGVANYGSGSVSTFKLDDAGVPTRVCLVQHEGKSVNPGRQEGPHAHSFQFTNDDQLALAADLGTDELVVYNVSSDGQLDRNESLTTKLPAGHGPRHFEIAPDGRYVLVIEELGSKVTVLRWGKNKLEMIGDYSTLPADFSGDNTTAEIQFHPNGRFVYGSNRGHDSLAVFAFDPVSGRLTSKGQVSTGGKTPRNFRPSPNGKWLIAANQSTDNLVVFALGDDGIPKPTGQSLQIPKPVCIKYLKSNN